MVRLIHSLTVASGSPRTMNMRGSVMNLSRKNVGAGPMSSMRAFRRMRKMSDIAGRSSSIERFTPHMQYTSASLPARNLRRSSGVRSGRVKLWYSTPCPSCSTRAATVSSYMFGIGYTTRVHPAERSAGLCPGVATGGMIKQNFMSIVHYGKSQQERPAVILPAGSRCLLSYNALAGVFSVAVGPAGGPV